MKNIVDFWADRRNRLIFKISRQCPVGCSWCCEKDGVKDRLHLSEMKDWIYEADETGLVKILAFTGGDPMVHLDDIRELGRLSHGLGWEMSIMTSAYWARSPQETREILRELQGLGLKRISYSCDPEHQRRVPLEYVRNALYASLGLGLSGLVFGTFPDDSQKVEDFLGPSPDSGRYAFNSRLISDYNQDDERVGKERRLDRWACYRQFGHDILVQPNADILPCCSTNNVRNPLLVGNLRQGDQLEDMIYSITGSFLLRILKHHSFAKLQEITERHFPGSTASWPDPQLYPNPCYYCLRLFEQQERVDAVYSALHQEEPLYWAEFENKYVLQT